MYVKKMCGYVVLEGIFSDFKKGLLDSYAPPTQESRNYKNWTAILDLKTCLECRARHGQIYHMGEIPDEEPPLHPNCRCKIKPMKAVKAGNGTKAGQNGADWWMKYNANLPEHYITEEELKETGLEMEKKPRNLHRGKWQPWEFTNNRENHLPQIPGRVWFETLSAIIAEGGMGTVLYGQTNRLKRFILHFYLKNSIEFHAPCGRFFDDIK